MTRDDVQMSKTMLEIDREYLANQPAGRDTACLGDGIQPDYRAMCEEMYQATRAFADSYTNLEWKDSKSPLEYIPEIKQALSKYEAMKDKNENT